MEIWQSCNGLLLCHDLPDKLYVYNPTTNHYKLLPLPHIWEPPDGYRLGEALALGFDPTVSPHYKVMYARGDNRCVHVDIYSSETGSWRACGETFRRSYFVMFDGNVVYWRGAVHWLDRLHVLHFSLDTENPHFIQVEDHRSLYGITYAFRDKLLVSPSHDCLLLVRMLQMQMNVYEMKDYAGGWSVKYHVDLQQSLAPGPRLNVVSIVLGEREEDSFVVVEVPDSMLIQYNIVSNSFLQLYDLTQIQIRNRQSRFCSYLFTPSLVGV